MTRLALALTFAIAACGPPSVERAGGPQGSGAADADVAIRFAIEVAEEQAPLYVAPYDESAQPAWVTAFRDGIRIYFRERCEIEECGVPPAVCGAALPTVVDLNRRPNRRIETVWDGTTSVIDATAGCERRIAAPAGQYVARFCYSLEAEFEGEARAGPVPGRLVNRACTDVPFQLGDSLVLLEM